MCIGMVLYGIMPAFGFYSTSCHLRATKMSLIIYKFFLFEYSL
jgi:hypothetical protein